MPYLHRRLDLAVALTAVAYLASQIWLMSIYHPLGRGNCFTFWFAVDKPTALGVLDAWGAEGVARFKQHYRLDFIHPFLYGALLYLLMKRFCLGLFGAGGTRLMFALPWVSAGCDVIENLLQLRVIRLMDAAPEALVFASGTFARAKWSLAGLSVLIVVAGIATTLTRWSRSR